MPLGVTGAALIVLSVLVFYFDIVRRKIPNFLTFPAMLLGLLYHGFTGGWSGLGYSLGGLLLGAGLLLLPFVLGGMGAGDVKYLAAVGALQGAGFTAAAALLSALAGGAAAFFILLLQGRLRLTLLGLFGAPLSRLLAFLAERLRFPLLFRLAARAAPPRGERKHIYLPYGVAIALGALLLLSGAVQRYMPGLFPWL